MPPLDHLTMAELSALRNELHRAGRGARKDASKAIMKEPGLKNLWLKTISLKGTDEQQATTLEAFNRALVQYPVCFLKHAYANSLILIDGAIHEEALKRADVAPVMARRR